MGPKGGRLQSEFQVSMEFHQGLDTSGCFHGVIPRGAHPQQTGELQSVPKIEGSTVS